MRSTAQCKRLLAGTCSSPNILFTYLLAPWSRVFLENLTGFQELKKFLTFFMEPEVSLPLGRRRRRWEDNIKMGLQEVGCGDIDWIELAQDRDSWRALMTAVMNVPVV